MKVCCLTCCLRFLAGVDGDSESSIELGTRNHNTQDSIYPPDTPESVEVHFNRRNIIRDDESITEECKGSSIFIGSGKLFITADPSAAEEEIFSIPVATLVVHSDSDSIGVVAQPEVYIPMY